MNQLAALADAAFHIFRAVSNLLRRPLHFSQRLAHVLNHRVELRRYRSKFVFRVRLHVVRQIARRRLFRHRNYLPHRMPNVLDQQIQNHYDEQQNQRDYYPHDVHQLRELVERPVRGVYRVR